jgi:hypothetical protein
METMNIHFKRTPSSRHERGGGIFDEVDEDETKKIKTQNTFSSEWDGWELAFILFAMKANET